MIRSMTGYGRGRAQVNGHAFLVEIRAVNHRYADINVKAPRALMAFEPKLRKRVAAVLLRGKIDVFVTPEPGGEALAVPVVNPSVAGAYVRLFRQLQRDFDLEAPIPLDLLVAQKDVLQIDDSALSSETLEPALFQALEQALQGMSAMRLAEGKATCDDIRARLHLVEEALATLASRAPQVPQEWRIKLADRLRQLDEDACDEQRLAQELALFADRCDVSEELARFRSHLLQFEELFKQEEPVGRKMDFLLQELNRETNTIGSKSNDAVLTRNVVLIKAELEKIREQVQNIE